MNLSENYKIEERIDYFYQPETQTTISSSLVELLNGDKKYIDYDNKKEFSAWDNPRLKIPKRVSEREIGNAFGRAFTSLFNIDVLYVLGKKGLEKTLKHEMYHLYGENGSDEKKTRVATDTIYPVNLYN